MSVGRSVTDCLSDGLYDLSATAMDGDRRVLSELLSGLSGDVAGMSPVDAVRRVAALRHLYAAELAEAFDGDPLARLVEDAFAVAAPVLRATQKPDGTVLVYERDKLAALVRPDGGADLRGTPGTMPAALAAPAAPEFVIGADLGLR